MSPLQVLFPRPGSMLCLFPPGMMLLLVLLAAPAHGAAGLAESEMRHLNEAVQLIRAHSLVPPKSSRGMTDDILRSYTRTLDEYSDYLTSREYAAFLESTSSDYFGVEMDIEKKGGRIFLFPFKDGIAEKSGIQAGDELIAVNGAPVYGQSIFVVGAQIRGADGMTVQLILRSGQGIPRALTLRRQSTDYVSVRSKIMAQARYIQITRFAKNTGEQLEKVLQAGGEDGGTLVVDLRRNQGGSLRVARQCADLFLERGAVLFKLRYRDGVREILAERPPSTTSRIVLIQDDSTASAAEAFIVALRGNGRAVSIGRTTYGKGLAQRFLPLADGSALLVTYAEILTPDGAAYHNQGLQPDLVLPDDWTDVDYNQEESLSGLFDFLQQNQND
jgi:carboxyl-terminal processing protease